MCAISESLHHPVVGSFEHVDNYSGFLITEVVFGEQLIFLKLPHTIYFNVLFLKIIRKLLLDGLSSVMYVKEEKGTLPVEGSMCPSRVSACKSCSSSNWESKCRLYSFLNHVLNVFLNPSFQTHTN
jgi:hypothetical protein